MGNQLKPRTCLEELKEDVFNVLQAREGKCKEGTVSEESQMSSLSHSVPGYKSFKDIIADEVKSF